MNYFIKPWTKFADFEGRASRAEFWIFGVVNFFILSALLMLGRAIFGADEEFFLAFIFMLAMAIPGLAVTVRRLHDTDRSGWMFFIPLIPVLGALYFFILMVLPGTDGSNQYGSDPDFDD